MATPTTTLCNTAVTTNRLRGLVACLAATVAVIAGCANAEPAETAPSSSTASVAADADVAWSNVWSAGPGVDLFSRGAELVRASLEAAYLAQARGIDKTFPGYRAAIGPQPEYGDPQARAKNYGYVPAGYEPRNIGLTVLNYHLVDLVQTADRVSGTVCSYGLAPRPTERSKYLYDAYLIALSKKDGSPSGVPGVVDTRNNFPQRQGKVPTWDVFAPWTINRIQIGEASDVPASCTDWWRSVFPDAVKRPNSNQMTRSAPGPIAPANARQYPRWIGPSTTQ